MRLPICALCLVLLMGCDGGNSRPDDGASITLSGKLVAGVQALPSPPPYPRVLLPASPAPQPLLPPPGDPLVGYQLYCVTFATPPAAATATADDTGQVTLGLDALGVAFGCFVLDAEGEGVATLIFTSGQQQGQTITLTGDTDLGSIVVDLDNGIAQTDVSSTGTLTGSDGLPCPLGTWVSSVPREDCDGMATATLWFALDADGRYRASFKIGLIELPTTRVCGYRSEADLPVTGSGGALTFSFLNNPTCDLVFTTLTATADADCAQLSLEGSIDGCASCIEGQCGCGEGALSCPQSFIATRQ